MVAFQAEEERKRRLSAAQETEQAGVEERRANQKKADEAMEAERNRRLSEAPDSPSALMQAELVRQASKKNAVQQMEQERLRRLNLDTEVEQSTILQRRKSQTMVSQQMEAERARRIKTPLKGGKASSSGGLGTTLIVLVSTVAILSLVALTLEEQAAQYGWYDSLESLRATVGEYIPALAPPPPPPPAAKMFGFF